MRFVLVFCFVVGGALAIESNFYREEACAQANGFCLYESECPQPENVRSELCAGQKSSNAVCCVGFPQSEVNCFQTHNDCRKRCRKTHDLGPKGCPSGETCCVLT